MKTALIKYIIVVAGIVSAQWSTSTNADNILYVCPGFIPTINVLEDGSSFIFGTSVRNIWVQKLNPFGVKQWSQPIHAVNNRGASVSHNVSSISDENGGVIFYWRDDRNAEFNEFSYPAQNAIYLQRISSTGQKMWTDTGIVAAPLDGGLKGASICGDGEGGVLVRLGESDFDRPTSPKKEKMTLMRFDKNGKLLWSKIIDSSSVRGSVPTGSIVRMNNKLLILTKNGPRVIDINTLQLFDPILKSFGLNFKESENSLLNVQRIETIDSLGRHYLQVKLLNLNGNFDSLWSIEYTSPVRSDTGDDYTALLPYIIPDNQGGVFFSHGYVFTNPYRYTIFVQYITKNGPQWEGSGYQIQTTSWPIFGFCGNPGLGLIFNDYSHQKIDINGDSIYSQRIKLINAVPGMLDYFTIEADNYGGAITAFWRGGIFAHHTGRNGQLGQILSANYQSHVSSSKIVLTNYPNPFNSSTNISFSVHTSGNITITIYDILGREIEVVHEGYLDKGSYNFNWSSKSLSSGVYIYKLASQNAVVTKKMLLVN